jgi:MFS family permease
VLAVFIWHERRVTDPVLDLRLFRDRSYTVGAAVITLYFAAFTPVFFIFTLLLQLGLGYTPVEAGAAITPFAAGAAISATVAGRLAIRYARDLIATGLLLILAGLLGSTLAVALAPSHGTGWAALVPILIAGVGGGMIVAPNQSLSLSHVPLPEAGAAAGLLQTGIFVTTAITAAALVLALIDRHQARTRH